jgi:hypothetical protein
MLTGTVLSRVSDFFKLMLGSLPFMLAANAQDTDEEQKPTKPLDEIVTVGSQIQGAQISDALAVSVIQAAEIEALGVDSGDELLEFIAEQGQNYFSESENISGGVNSALAEWRWRAGTEWPGPRAGRRAGCS